MSPFIGAITIISLSACLIVLFIGVLKYYKYHEENEEKENR